VGRRARGRRQRAAEDADHDRGHGQVLFAPGPLAQHPLAEEHQQDQPSGERRLHHHEGREQQRHDLQRPAHDREPGAQQPSGTLRQPQGERRAQMLIAGRLLGVHRLEGDP